MTQIDIFAVNQHMGSADAPAWQSSRESSIQSRAEVADDLMGDDLHEDNGFKAVIATTRRTVVSLQPWYAPLAISCVWCLRDLHDAPSIHV